MPFCLELHSFANKGLKCGILKIWKWNPSNCVSHYIPSRCICQPLMQHFFVFFSIYICLFILVAHNYSFLAKHAAILTHCFCNIHWKKFHFADVLLVFVTLYAAFRQKKNAAFSKRGNQHKYKKIQTKMLEAHNPKHEMPLPYRSHLLVVLYALFPVF